MRFDSPKRRRRLSSHDPMASQLAKEILEEVKLKFGHEIRVFETSTSSALSTEASADEPDDFFDLTAEDYLLMLSSKKEDKVLKTRKIREAEEAARKSKITKAVIRVRFPDNYTLEATFNPSEAIQSLVDLLKRVVAQPDLPFYMYTTPPKKQVNDLSLNFHSAGFVPGAIVYFSYDVPEGDNSIAVSGSFLREDVLSLKDLDFIPEQVEPSEAAPNPEITIPPPAISPEQKPTGKKPFKPKWLKM